MWVLIAIAALLLLLLFYPIRLILVLHFDKNGLDGHLHLHPVLAIARWPISLWDSNLVKKHKKKQEKAKKKGKVNKAKATDSDRKISGQDVRTVIDEVADLLRAAGHGVTRLRVRLLFAFSLGDPARTGELCGALYAALPLLFVVAPDCRFRLRLEPLWQEDELCGHFEMNFRLCLLDLLRAFGPIAPKLWAFIKKMKSGGKDNERTSHRSAGRECTR